MAYTEYVPICLSKSQFTKLQRKYYSDYFGLAFYFFLLSVSIGLPRFFSLPWGLKSGVIAECYVQHNFASLITFCVNLSCSTSIWPDELGRNLVLLEETTTSSNYIGLITERVSGYPLSTEQNFMNFYRTKLVHVLSERFTIFDFFFPMHRCYKHSAHGMAIFMWQMNLCP